MITKKAQKIRKMHKQNQRKNKKSTALSKLVTMMAAVKNSMYVYMIFKSQNSSETIYYNRRKKRRSEINILLQKYHHDYLDDVIRYVLVSYVGIGACAIDTYSSQFSQ